MEIQHSEPAWREKANFIAGVELQKNRAWPGFSSEQLAMRELDDGSYLLCCIPFAAYDLCLGDIVRLDKDLNVEVKADDGDYWGFRIATRSVAEQECVLKKIRMDDFYHEHWAEQVLAVAVKGEKKAKIMANILQSAEDRNEIVEYETIRTVRNRHK